MYVCENKRGNANGAVTALKRYSLTKLGTAGEAKGGSYDDALNSDVWVSEGK